MLAENFSLTIANVEADLKSENCSFLHLGIKVYQLSETKLLEPAISCRDKQKLHLSSILHLRIVHLYHSVRLTTSQIMLALPGVLSFTHPYILSHQPWTQ
jgi:hypothetical protein